MPPESALIAHAIATDKSFLARIDAARKRALDGPGFDQRPDRELRKLISTVDAELAAARDELQLSDKAAKKAAAAVHAAEIGDRRSVEKFLNDRKDRAA